jgi:hypothetical protein
MAALSVATDRAAAREAETAGPASVRSAGPTAADRSGTGAQADRSVRSWPLLVLAAPAAAEVWSGWVGIAQAGGWIQVSAHAPELSLITSQMHWMRRTCRKAPTCP